MLDLRHDIVAHRKVPVRLVQAYARRAPQAEVMDGLCRDANIVVLRGTPATTPHSCTRRLLTQADFTRGGALEACRRPAGNWRLVWTQNVRGRRPWSIRPSDISE